MKNPKDMEAIEIDLTNACVHRCSNCTRFCGHHKKPFFMDFETFKKAVDSLQDYKGIIGIIGGEPTIHPEFEKFMQYLKEKRVGKTFLHSREPITDMQRHIDKNFNEYPTKAMLCSSLNLGYYKNFEIINETFERQLLNDHNNTCIHQALLMSRKELGIPDDEWIQKRDACWIQNTWSATVTPKGAFFCEVAGSLDMLFNGPGGWDITEDWWKREPKDFGDQLQWCEMCSACLDVPKRLSNDGRDDVTPLILQKLIEIGSPKALKGLCVVNKPEDYNKAEYETFKTGCEYIIAAGHKRIGAENRNLYPKSFAITTKENLADFVKTEKPKDWIIVASNEKKAKKAQKYFEKFIINPGCLYLYCNCFVFNAKARSIRDYIKNPDSLKAEKLKEYYPKDKIITISYKTRIKKRVNKIMQKASTKIIGTKNRVLRAIKVSQK